ncbi:hypothetical protein IMZ48_18490 [Candidatus Bathyarchaeota archaeon]|nr:hypothetical protein [Candidatus Bathyarchaeota archaeon]
MEVEGGEKKRKKMVKTKMMPPRARQEGFAFLRRTAPRGRVMAGSRVSLGGSGRRRPSNYYLEAAGVVEMSSMWNAFGRVR